MGKKSTANIFTIFAFQQADYQTQKRVNKTKKQKQSQLEPVWGKKCSPLLNFESTAINQILELSSTGQLWIMWW